VRKEIKTSVAGLRKGMYVSKLDRPWIQTSYALQGLLIQSEEDIERLKRYCNHVFVDVEKGDSPSPRYWVLGGDKKTHSAIEYERNRKEQIKKSNLDDISRRRTTTYADTVTFSNEINTARTSYKQVENNFQNVIQDLRKGHDLDLETVSNGINDMVESMIRNPSAMMWVTQLKRLDEYTYGHALGTSVWCATFGRHLGLDKKSIEQLALGGLLQDLGKTRIPPELLIKSGELDEEEIQQLQTHVDLSVKTLSNTSRRSTKRPLPISILQMVATHHERFDGSGYPQGLLNEDIPFFGKIAGIVDSFDAMTSLRPYIPGGPLPPYEAVSQLYDLRDIKFQGELVEQFIQAVGLYPAGTLVELSNGQVGTVIRVNTLRRLRPTVMLLLDTDKQPLDRFVELDLVKAPDEIRVERGLPPGSFGINMAELFL
jgi:HD-GYP domain-containing protein (c-di-GMP phosphodiesterase class II)